MPNVLRSVRQARHASEMIAHAAWSRRPPTRQTSSSAAAECWQRSTRPLTRTACRLGSACLRGSTASPTPCAHSPYRYLMDSQEQLNAMLDSESRGLELLAFYHSHTHSQAYINSTYVRRLRTAPPYRRRGWNALQSGWLDSTGTIEGQQHSLRRRMPIAAHTSRPRQRDDRPRPGGRPQRVLRSAGG